jgi:hypothetical protein
MAKRLMYGLWTVPHPMEVLLLRLAAIFAGGQRTVRKLMRFITLLLLLGAKIMAHQVCAPITIQIITVHSSLT